MTDWRTCTSWKALSGNPRANKSYLHEREKVAKWDIIGWDWSSVDNRLTKTLFLAQEVIAVARPVEKTKSISVTHYKSVGGADHDWGKTSPMMPYPDFIGIHTHPITVSTYPSMLDITNAIMDHIQNGYVWSVIYTSWGKIIMRADDRIVDEIQKHGAKHVIKRLETYYLRLQSRNHDARDVFTSPKTA